MAYRKEAFKSRIHQAAFFGEMAPEWYKEKGVAKKEHEIDGIFGFYYNRKKRK